MGIVVMLQKKLETSFQTVFVFERLDNVLGLIKILVLHIRYNKLEQYVIDGGVLSPSDYNAKKM